MRGGRVCNMNAWCARGKVLIKKDKGHTHKQAESYWRVEFEDTPQRWMLQIEYQHVMHPLITYSRNEERNLSGGTQQDTNGESEVSKVAGTQQTTDNRSNDDANMIRNGRKGGPAKLLEGIQRR